ncbi:MAG: hypothetical protein AAF353_00025 [Pseudomonadota bacterium]
MSKTDQKSSSARRKTLKTALAGGTVAATIPSAWLKPTVSSVVLPGHAATTGDGGEPGGGTTTMAPVCDPQRVAAIDNFRIRARSFEGGNEGNFTFEAGIQTGGVQPSSATLVSDTLVESGAFEVYGSGESNEVGMYINTEADFSQGVPATVSVEFVFPDQPAPCVVTADIDYID